MKIIREVKNSVLYPFIITIIIISIITALNANSSKEHDYLSILILIIFTLTAQGVIFYIDKLIYHNINYPIIFNKKIKFINYRLYLIFLSLCPFVFIIFDSLIFISIIELFVIIIFSSINYNIFNRIQEAAGSLSKVNHIDHFVFTAGTNINAYQANQWAPVLEQSKHSFAFIVKNLSIAHSIKTSSIPIFIAPSIHSMERVISGGAKSILYTGNSIDNMHLFRFTWLKHIFINHGESDKVVNQNKVMMAYDHLFLGGKLAEDRLRDAGCDLRPNQPMHIGRPQTELHLNKQESDSKKIQKILYVPTWEGVVDDADYSSVRLEGFEMIQKLSEHSNYEVRIKFHPLTGSRYENRARYKRKISDLSKKNEIAIYDADTPIEDLMNWSDAMICDISSVLNEYLYTNKPIILTAFGSALENNLNERFPSSKACHILNDCHKIIGVADGLNNENAELKINRERLLEYSLSTSKGSSLKRFDDALDTVCDN